MTDALTLRCITHQEGEPLFTEDELNKFKVQLTDLATLNTT